MHIHEIFIGFSWGNEQLNNLENIREKGLDKQIHVNNRGIYNIILSEGDAKYSITKIKYWIQILIAQMHINITVIHVYELIFRTNEQ